VKQVFSGYPPFKIFLQGEIIQKWGKTGLWFFGTALCLNALFHCVQFKQIMSKGYQVMLQTRFF
jgi:hypothetical protein